MSLSQFNDFKELSNVEISKVIIKNKKRLFFLRFKKATRQSFKSHEFKCIKRKIAQLKTLLTFRLNTVKTNN